jgi:hypothetical protein
MTLRFLALSGTENADGTYDATRIDSAHFDGSVIFDRVLEGVTLVITQQADGSMVLICPHADDQAYIESGPLSMDKIWKKTLTYIEPGEELLSCTHNGQNLDVEIWDDQTPLPDHLRLVG